MHVILPRHLLRLLLSFVAFGMLAGQSTAAKRPRALDELFVVLAREPAWHFQASSLEDDVKAAPLTTGRKLAIGSTVGTGEHGTIRLLLGGHTVVDLDPQTVVGFPGRIRGKKGGEEERIIVLRGSVRTYTDATHLPGASIVSLVGGKKKQTSQGGYMITEPVMKRPGTRSEARP